MLEAPALVSGSAAWEFIVSPKHSVLRAVLRADVKVIELQHMSIYPVSIVRCVDSLGSFVVVDIVQVFCLGGHSIWVA